MLNLKSFGQPDVSELPQRLRLKTNAAVCSLKFDSKHGGYPELWEIASLSFCPVSAGDTSTTMAHDDRRISKVTL